MAKRRNGWQRRQRRGKSSSTRTTWPWGWLHQDVLAGVFSQVDTFPTTRVMSSDRGFFPQMPRHAGICRRLSVRRILRNGLRQRVSACLSHASFMPSVSPPRILHLGGPGCLWKEKRSNRPCEPLFNVALLTLGVSKCSNDDTDHQEYPASFTVPFSMDQIALIVQIHDRRRRP